MPENNIINPKQINEILLATTNKGKIAEFQSMLADFDIKIRSLDEFDIEDVEETGKTFFDNAKLKAVYYSQHSGLPALADDSGLCVVDMGNAPGVKTARYASTPLDGMLKIIHTLDNLPNCQRKAFFQCNLVLALPSGGIQSFVGVVNGSIAPAPIGDKGFAYDHIFIPDGFNVSFGQMDKSQKSSISHRGRALQNFLQWFLNVEK